MQTSSPLRNDIFDIKLETLLWEVLPGTVLVLTCADLKPERGLRASPLGRERAAMALLYFFLPAAASANGGVKSYPRHSVSGQSAGGSAAVQHLVAFSSLVDGAAVAAGSPYGCGSLARPDYTCMHGTGMSIRSANQYLEQRAAEGKIDDPKNLKRTPVILFSGSGDSMVYMKVMIDVQKQLQSYVDEDKLHSNFETAAGHVWSIDHGACVCGVCPYGGLGNFQCCQVNNCEYDLSGEFMRATYGMHVKPRATASPNLYWINQWDYWTAGPPKLTATVMEWMVAYVPDSCKAAPSQCKLHINYHGCSKPEWRQRIAWATGLDLNEYAEANDMIVLYPQAQGSHSSGEGCWNWEAYGDDPDFDTREGKEMSMVMRIAANLTLAVKHALVSTDGKPPPEVEEAHDDNRYFYSYGWGENEAAERHVNTNERKAHARPMPPAEEVEAPAPAGTIASFVAIIGAASAPANGLSTTAVVSMGVAGAAAVGALLVFAVKRHTHRRDVAEAAPAQPYSALASPVT